MKDNSPLFHATLLTVFLLVVGFAAFKAGTPQSGLLRPGVQNPAPFVPLQKILPSAPEQTAPPLNSSEPNLEQPAVSQ
jgi:hypothetical protein